MKFNKLPTKHSSSEAKLPADYMLPRLSIPHKAVPATKTHAVGQTHTMVIKAKKVSHDENGSSYKITHIAAKNQPQGRAYLLSSGKSSGGFGSMENNGQPF